MPKQYQVSLEVVDGTASCSCMDARINCRRLQCACKHVCFVVFQVLQIDAVRVYVRVCACVCANAVRSIATHTCMAGDQEHMHWMNF